MAQRPASVPASFYAQKKRRALTEKLGLAPNALPAGGNFYPEEDVLSLLADEVAGRDAPVAVCCGGGPAVAVMAKAGAGVTVLETDGRMAAVTDEMVAGLGVTARVIETGLDDYDKHNLWYPRHTLNSLPERIDVLFLDGPGHFAGRMPRWPAGPELFGRLAPDGVVVLDDGRRVKEKKALQRWAEDFPGLEQINTNTGAVLLRPRTG